jgi:hypothetical protein
MACFGLFCSSPEDDDDLPVPDKIKRFIDKLSTKGGLKKNIVSIKDVDSNIDISGYSTKEIYGKDALWSIDTILQDVLDRDLYATVTKAKCTERGKESSTEIKFTNPDKSIDFEGVDIFRDVALEELPIPAIVNTMYSYTYVVVLAQQTFTYHIRFGKVNDFMELGVKHSILAGGDRIVVSGELAIKRYEKRIEYIVNINSSKMMKHERFSRLMYDFNMSNGNFIAMPETKYAYQFYYIFMIQLALGIMKRISPRLDIRVPRGTIITYEAQQYNSMSEKDELLVSYYTEKDNTPCPSDESIKKYNRYGLTEDTPYGMCIDKMEEDGYHLIKNNGRAEECPKIQKMGRRRKSVKKRSSLLRKTHGSKKRRTRRI